MKSRTLALAALLLLAGTALLLAATKAPKNQPMDANGHVLLAQWAEYEKMKQADRPQKQADILLQIRDEAMKRHLSADFYDAGKQYIVVSSLRNWKRNDSLRADFGRLVERFDEPIVTYAWMDEFANKPTEARWAYVQSKGDAFSKGHHPEFYRNLYPYLGGALKEFVTSDREYVLWDLLRRRSIDWETPKKDEIYAALKAEIGDRYPAVQTLRYYVADHLPQENADKQPLRKPALEALAADPAMGAVAFYPRQDLLQDRFTELNNQRAGSADYKALEADCKRFVSDKAKLSGAEARIAKACNVPRDLIETLNEKGLFLSVVKDSIAVVFRNLSSADVKIAGKTIPVRNPAGSFYALDRVAVPLPTLEDGDYEIEAVSGKHTAQAFYNRHTLSLAVRTQADGTTVYVTDYLTGEPLQSCRLILRKGDKEVASEILPLDGFTRIPAAMQKTLDGARNVYYTFVAEIPGPDGLTRRSTEAAAGRYRDDASRTEVGTYCNIYTDQGAYKPGDTLRFKAVLFRGDLTQSAAVLPDTKLEVRLQNAQGEQIESKKLKTNEFGSIAGAFFLPKGHRGGRFQLQVWKDGRHLASRTLRVDEFVLPTFTLAFEPVDQLFLVGEEAEVRGRISSFSGHSLSGAAVTAQVLRYSEVILEQAVQPAEDGSFVLHFTPKQAGLYRTTIKVVDATGETLDFETSVYVADRVTVRIDVRNAADGSFVAADETAGSSRRGRIVRPSATHYLVEADSVRVEMSARNTQGDRVPMTLSYVLRDGAGNVVAEAQVPSGTVVTLPLRESCLYDLQVAAKVPGKEIGDDRRCRILKVGAADKALDAPVRRVFLTGKDQLGAGEKIRVRMGTADGEEWAVATVFGRNREVLATRKLHLKGARAEAGSLETLEWTYDPAWPEAVRVVVFYFKYGEAVTYDHVFHRVRTTLDLPLSFSSFTDRTLPGTQYTFTLQTQPGVEAVAAVYDKSLDAFGANHWPTVTLRQFTPSYVSCSSACGSVTGVDPFADAPKFDSPLPAAQPGKIVGVVVDADGAPVIGASVAVAGSAKGAVTDVDGRFVLDGVPSGTQLTVSSIGYVQTKVTAMSVMRVVLEEDTTMLDEVAVIGYGMRGKTGGIRVRGLAKNAAVSDGVVYEMVEERAAPMMSVNTAAVQLADAGEADAPDAVLREKFESALAFEPFLRSGADGSLSLTFSTSDKLSTYYVSVFAHDPAMRNALVRREMVVSTPVKVSVVEPKYLYAGDKYVVKVSVASSAGRDLRDGVVALKLFSSADRSSAPFKTLSGRVPLLADGATESVSYEIEAGPELLKSGVLGIQAVYAAGTGAGAVSDGVFLTVPVRPAVQTLTEAHSAVLLAGQDREALIARLRSAFVNVDGSDASVEEISILDMVRAALPSKVEPSGEDVLSLSEALYVRLVAGSLGVVLEPEMSNQKLLERIRACQNGDGGFAWFEGMKSSPVITAVLLERFAKLAPMGLYKDFAAEQAVRFLDRNQFDYEWPFWCGGLGTDRYLYVRSFYPEVPFEVKGSGATFAARMKEFKKYVPDYLVPRKERGLSGQILPKARRLRTLQNLLSGPDGIALAKAWGVNFGAEGKMQKSLHADVVSLLEYAVDHRDGGKYYPNAVLPWRGLLESEAYAHALLCDLLSGLSGVVAVPAAEKAQAADVADGIRLWLMLQKETQQWDADPAFVDAIHSVLSGSEEVLQTRVIALRRTFEKPFAEIAPAGNGFTVARKFYRASAVEEVYNDRTEEENRQVLEWEEIAPGAVLAVGDKIAVEYSIWNAENRSFVKLSAPREASLRPVQQLSGSYGWGIRPLRIDGLWSFQPQGYRDVKTDHTDYYFDTYPEESTTVREEFFVTQAGVFTAPVVTIESLYAPHYRANDAFRAPLQSR